MPINPNLLIAAPMLQDLLVDKDGTPMASGTVTCYHDNSRTTLKNWYYQSGTPGNYTYVPLPNPLTLSAAGTICDINGVDTIPFFYPFSELDENTADPYYITIVNFAQTNQITRANFPFVPQSGSSPTTINAYNNLIINNGFWRNYAPNTLNVTPYTTITLNSVVKQNVDGNYALAVAPSQHDGFKLPDIQFIKNNTTGTDVLTFTPFPLAIAQPIENNIVPEYYINHVCNSQGSGETLKCYQFPISLHVNTLANVPFSGFIQAQNSGGTGSGANVISLYILQDTGTGTTSPAPILLATYNLNTTWSTYTFSGIFPATAGLNLSKGADDGLYLQVQMPLNVDCTINFTKPSIYLNTTVIPNNDFQTYDQVDAIINSPRTGDIRTSLNQHYFYGWVPMNNGTIGNGSSNATARHNADTWKLFNLIWTLFSAYNSGTTNPLAQMYSSAGSAVAYGASAISDFNANKAIALTQTMGKTLLGTVPTGLQVPPIGSGILLNTYQTIFAAANSAGNLQITAITAVNFFNGMPIYFFNNAGSTLPDSIALNTVYYVANFNGTTTFNVATTFANAIAGTVIAYISTSGSGAPFVSTLTGTLTGEYGHTQSINELVSHSHLPLSPNSSFLGNASPGTAALAAGTGVGTVATTATTGGGAAFNVTQPGYFMNLYIKL